MKIEINRKMNFQTILLIGLACGAFLSHGLAQPVTDPETPEDSLGIEAEAERAAQTQALDSIKKQMGTLSIQSEKILREYMVLSRGVDSVRTQMDSMRLNLESAGEALEAMKKQQEKKKKKNKKKTKVKSLVHIVPQLEVESKGGFSDLGTNNIELDRARFEIKASRRSSWVKTRANLRIDDDPDSPIGQAWVGADFKKYFNVRAGLLKIPFGKNNRQSRKDLVMPYRFESAEWLKNTGFAGNRPGLVVQGTVENTHYALSANEGHKIIPGFVMFEGATVLVEQTVIKKILSVEASVSYQDYETYSLGSTNLYFWDAGIDFNWAGFHLEGEALWADPSIHNYLTSEDPLNWAVNGLLAYSRKWVSLGWTPFLAGEMLNVESRPDDYYAIGGVGIRFNKIMKVNMAHRIKVDPATLEAGYHRLIVQWDCVFNL